MTFKHCRCCGLDKPLDAFGRKAKNLDGLQDHCKPCRSVAAAKAWADFRTAFIGPLWPLGVRRDRAANAGVPQPPAIPKRPKPIPAGDSRPSPKASQVRPSRSAFVGPPTRAQHAAAQARVERDIERRQAIRAAEAAQAIVALPMTPKPTEADLAARKASALAKAAELAALMRAPARA
jgi:hypothetical protein